MITAKDAWWHMAHLQSIYTIKQPANPEIYLGALYTGLPTGDTFDLLLFIGLSLVGKKKKLLPKYSWLPFGQ